MKKIMSILLSFCLILSVLISLPVQAEASNVLEISPGGTIQKVTYTQNGNSEEIRIYSSSTGIVRQYVIPPEGSVQNFRLVFEISDASVSKTVKFDVNKGTVVQIRMANMSDPRRTNVVVETKTKPSYKLGASSDGKSIVLTLNGDPSSSGTPAATPAPSPKPATSATPAPSPSVSATPKPQVTAPASSTPAPEGGSSDKAPVITSNGPLSWSLTGNTCRIELKGINLVQATVGNSPRFEVREKEKLIQITIPGKDSRFSDGFLTGNSVIYGALVSYNQKQNSTIIRIPYTDPITYSHTVSDGSSVFLLNKKSTSIPVNSPVPSSTPVTTPKPTPSSSATPAPSTTPSAPANTQPSNSPSNIKRGPGDGKTALILTGTGIVSRYNSYRNQIITDDPGKGSVTFMLPVSIVNLGSGTMTINDSLVKSVTTFTTAKNSFITIEKTNPNVRLEITTGSKTDELYISVASNSSGIVVLDPGHGGSDPGAVISGRNEKDYNLDIALRCEAILKSKGVNVTMTRSTDVYVSLEDRVKFANDKNATLFVSIHNNSMPNGMKGSMVLYHYTSYKGKAYATIMLNNLVKDLKTGNLGLSARQNTVVLRDTKMPAILAEVACMSDPGDLALLNTDAFIQKAAESIANSIIEILSSQ